MDEKRFYEEAGEAVSLINEALEGRSGSVIFMSLITYIRSLAKVNNHTVKKILEDLDELDKTMGKESGE